MLTRCPRCGDIFSKQRQEEICPRCRADESRRIDSITKYLDQHPDATIDDLERVSGIPKEVILTYARERRLVALDAAVLKIKCEECGIEIHAGRFCPPCRKKLAAKFEAGIHHIRGIKDKQK